MKHEGLSDDDSSGSDQPLSHDDCLFDLSTVFSKLVRKGRKCGGKKVGIDDEELADGDDPVFEKLQSSMMEIVNSCILTPQQMLKLSSLDAKANLHKRARIAHDCNPKKFRTMGKFSDDELILLQNRWSTFCSEYGFDEIEDLKIFIPNSFCPPEQKLSYAQREWFLQYLSQDFPDRDPEAVYQKFVDVFLTWKKGSWSSEEDDFLLSWYNLMPDLAIYSICAFVLHRRRSLVSKRLIKLTDCSAPIKSIMDLKKIKQSEVELADPNVPEYPKWTRSDKKWEAIAAYSNTNRRLLMRKYYFELNPAIRAAGFQTTKMEEKDVLYWLTKENPSSWDSVDWFKLGRKCNNIGAVKAYHIIRQMTVRRVPVTLWEDLPAVLARLNKKLTRKFDKTVFKTEEETYQLHYEDDNMSDSV